VVFEKESIMRCSSAEGKHACVCVCVGGEGAGTKYRGPAARKGARVRAIVYKFLSSSVVFSLVNYTNHKRTQNFLWGLTLGLCIIYVSFFKLYYENHVKIMSKSYQNHIKIMSK